MRTLVVAFAAATLASCAPEPVALAPGAPARVEVFRPRRNLAFELSDGAWVSARSGRAARPGEIERLLGALRVLRAGPALAPSSASAAYGLGPADSLRLRVTAADGGVLFDGEFGRRTAGAAAYFRARPGAPVRLAEGLDPESLRGAEDEWLLPAPGFDSLPP